MGDQAPEIRVTLTAEDKGVSAAIKELGNQLSQLKQKQNEVADSSLNLKSAFDAVISSAVVLKVIEFGKEVVKTATDMARLSAATGISAGTLSVYRQAAGDAGVSQDKVNTGLIRLSTNIVKFEAGGKQGAAAFQLLNLSQKSFVGLNSDQKLALVANAVGKMADGTNKAYIVNQLFGRGAANLIPVLDQLAGQGFDNVKQHAQELGTYLAADGITKISAAAVSMHELQDVAEGMATQFVTGLAPAISDVGDALAKATTQSGESGFKSIGAGAGTALRYVANLFLDLGATAAAVVATIDEEFDGMWKEIKIGGETVANAIKSGSFKGVWNALSQGAKQAESNSKDEAGRIAAIWANLGAQVTQNFANLFPTDEEEERRMKERAAKIKGTGAGVDKAPPDTSRDKAQLAALEALLQNELALYKAKNSAEESGNQIAYNQGLESLQAFYSKKKQLAKDDSDQEIATLYAKQIALRNAPTDKTAAAEIERQQKLATLQSQIDAAKVNAASKQKQLDAQEAQDNLSLQEKVLEFQGKIAAAQGKTFDEAEARIAIEVQRMAIALAQAGQSSQQIDQELAAYRASLEEQKGFKTTEDTGKAALAALANKREEIQLNNTDLVAKQKVAALEKSELGNLEQIAAQLKAMAIASHDPQQIKAAEDFAKGVGQIKVSIQQASVSWKDFDNQVTSAIQGDLSTFLGSTIDHVHGIGDAFGQLANTAVSSIQKIVAQLIVMIAFKKISNALDQVSGAGGGIGGLFHALHLAEGGVVPGVGNTDSVPAMLMPGEFVMSKAAVRGFGVEHLATINQGVRVPSIAGMAIPHFAEGGLVQGNGGGAGGDLRLGIGLDEGLILKHLSSKSAGRVILRHLASNPKAAGKALSRGQ